MLSLTLAALVVAVSALNGIVVPASIEAGTGFEASFQDANDDQYRIYVAAALSGVNGPTCYLVNSTSLDASVNLTIPADIGPSASYYSIAIADLTTGQASTFSNRFNFTNATGEYSDYENQLGGSPFWDANSLPCSAYSCARECADASYPEDLTETKAFDTMSKCIMACDGVTASVNQTSPAHASTTSSTSSSSSSSQTKTGSAEAETSSSAASRNSAVGAALAGFAGVAMLL
ncbi:uncharacterized protein RCC_00133 [Ramularia collo-cygni]|uniref:Uncharacterized protein n=1 Tax=Ramularia collo-cygni TaxID=112498 RepID=A0A2D3UQ31_9PEZI|nr:uncharacterized protein RCC_00133 [Ramularia collo-cygni]CZT14160.1 uncharacterized protein RCC_00133 [Ramularia collo-cygni]